MTTPTTTPNSRWQDWASFALGLWLAVSPWALGSSGHEASTANAAIMGLALALGSHFEVSFDGFGGEWFNLAAGAWLIAAPFALGFTMLSDVAANSMVVGAMVAWLAASALSLDRDVAQLLKGKRAARP